MIDEIGESVAALTHGNEVELDTRALEAALQELCDSNDDLVRRLRRASHKAGGIAEQQHRAKNSALGQAPFTPEVLLVLKRNADQLLELKKQHIAERKAAKETSQKLMQWSLATSVGADDLQADAVKHGRFKYFMLPGSNIATGTTSSTSMPGTGRKFWQVGIQGAPWRLSESDKAGQQSDQQGLLQSQKSLTSLLFGKSRRSLGGSSGSPSSPSRRVTLEPAGSWRSSYDSGGISSRRHSGNSGRSSDGGTHQQRASISLAQVPAVVAPAVGSEGGIWASLAAGEGPLSKSHSLLAKPGPQQQEQMVGKSLECVTEDEREGRDSPVPAGGGSGSRGAPEPLSPSAIMQAAPPPIRTGSAAGGRNGGPLDNFSFGNKQQLDEEAHSPSFLHGSVSGRLIDGRGSVAASDLISSVAGAAGPLVRSSLALSRHAVNKVDPFDAVEPEPQLQFVEQMKQEDKALKAARMSLSGAGGMMGSLRRSISGAARASGRISSSSSTSAPKWDVDGVAGPLASAAGQLSHVQQCIAAATSCGGVGADTAMQAMQQQPPDEAQAAEETNPADNQQQAGVSSDSQAAELTETVAEVAPDGTKSAAITNALPQGSCEITPADDHECSTAQQQQQQQSEQEQIPYNLPTAGLSPQVSGMMPAASLGAAAQQQRAAQAATQPYPASAATQQSGSRRPSSAGGIASPVVCSSPCRPLPSMGQASMEILSRQPVVSVLGQQGHQPGKQLVNSSINLRLTEVYQATSGTPSPLAAGLASLRRSSSQGGRSTGPGTVPGSSSSSSRGTSKMLLAEPQPQLYGSYMQPPAVGPLQQQYSSTMLQAKRSSGVSSLLSGSPREVNKKAWDWQQLGLPTGPGGQLSEPTVGPISYASGNKYAQSWGLVDAASSAGGASTTRQSGPGMAGGAGVPRQQLLSRQSSAGSQRGTPRYPGGVGPDSQPSSARQQWQQQPVYSAGRYATTSITPTESHSPRSERGGLQPAGSAGVLGWQPMQQQHSAVAAAASSAVPAAEDTSDDFHSAAETMSIASASSSRRGTAGGHGASGAGVVPTPPAFLQPPTSAQAAVAAQWNPNSTGLVRPYVVVPVSPEASVFITQGVQGQGLSPKGMASPYASPRSSESGMRQAVLGTAGGGQVVGNSSGNLSRQASSSRLHQQGSSGGMAAMMAYAGGYNVHPSAAAAQDAAMMMNSRATGGVGRTAVPQHQAGMAQQQQQQQQWAGQQVLDAHGQRKQQWYTHGSNYY